LRKSDLGAALTHRLPPGSSDALAFSRFLRMLGLVVHGQFQTVLEDLKDAYAPFDPDADTRAASKPPQAELERLRGRLFARFGWRLTRGNFVRLAEAEINQALADCTQWGLHLSVDFELFDRLELYYRGDTIGTRYRRRLRNRFRPEEVRVPIYQRLVVIFRLRPTRRNSLLNTDDVYIKLFKDIPKLDLDMLLPGTQV